MKVIGQIFVLLLGLALIGALGTGAYFAFKFIAELFGRMNLQVAAVTAVASIVVLLAAAIIASSIRAGRQNKANQLQAEKAGTYQHFISLWGDLLQQEYVSDDRSPAKLFEELQTLDRLLALYGSPAVVNAKSRFEPWRMKVGRRTRK